MELAPYPHLQLQEEDDTDEDCHQESYMWDRLWTAVQAAESSHRIATDMQYQAGVFEGREWRHILGKRSTAFFCFVIKYIEIVTKASGDKVETDHDLL